MTLPDVNEYFDGRKTDDQTEIKARRKQLFMLSQAVVEAGNLTGVVQWDRFLSYLAAGAETCQQQAEALREKIADPLVVDHTEIMRLKISLEGWIQRGFAFDAVMGLPKDLLEIGEQARSLLERMPDESD